MNPQLFIDCIEQAVSLIRASGTRKDRMREELAAHLAASWEEERRRDDDAPAAAQRAIGRLGDLGELSRGLQESVPRLEQWLFTPLPFMRHIDAMDRALGRALSRRDPEIPWRHAARVTLRMTSAIAVTEVIVILVTTSIQARPHSPWPTILLWAIASLVVTAAGCIIFPLLSEAMTRALQSPNRSRLREALYLALSSIVVIGLGLGFVLIVSLGNPQDILFSRSDWPRLLVASLFAPPTLGFAARDSIARQRGRSGWGINSSS